MSNDRASDLALLGLVLSMVAGIAVTVLVLLGISCWPYALGLTLVLILATFRFGRLAERGTRHGWNRHKRTVTIAVIVTVITVVSLVICLGFWILGDPSSLVQVAAVNAVLLVAGLVAFFRTDPSRAV